MWYRIPVLEISWEKSSWWSLALVTRRSIGYYMRKKGLFQDCFPRSSSKCEEELFFTEVILTKCREFYLKTRESGLLWKWWQSWKLENFNYTEKELYHRFFPRRIIPDPVSRRCSVKKVFLKILQNSQKSTCARVSFLKTCNFIKKETLASVFLCIMQNF